MHPAGLELGALVDGLRAERAAIGRRFAQLLRNALLFTPADRPITIVTGSAPRPFVEITDAGVGIPAGELPFVFDRFSQADSSSTRKHNGLGLGLAIVRAIMSAHGGSIAMRSVPGETVFTLRLPLLDETDQTPQEPGPSGAS